MCLTAYYSMVLLANPNSDDSLEVNKVSQQLNTGQHSSREVSIVLIMHCFQAALSTTYDWKALRTTLQVTDHYLNQGSQTDSTIRPTVRPISCLKTQIS